MRISMVEILSFGHSTIELRDYPDVLSSARLILVVRQLCTVGPRGLVLTRALFNHIMSPFSRMRRCMKVLELASSSLYRVAKRCRANT